MRANEQTSKRSKPVRRLSFARLLVCSVALLPGCAKVGDPLPPIIQHPSIARHLELVQIAENVQLTFSLPAEEIEEVEIYRQPGTPIRADSGAKPAVRIEVQDLLQDEEAGRFLFRDRPGSGDQTWYYSLRLVNKSGRRSDFSKSVHTEPRVAALPPVQLTGEVQEDRVIVRWRAPEANIDGSRPPNVVGYRVNSDGFVSENEYVDRDFHFWEPQVYTVQTVTRRADPLILSEFSDSLTVVPRDVFPPRTPQNLTTLLWEGKIRIFWDANKEVDLQGYLVYRGRGPDRLEKSSSLVKINNYTDEDAAPGVTWYYSVTALDESGNESAQSKIVKVSVER